MLLTNYKPSGKDKWDIRVDGHKKGFIRKERGRFVARITRYVGWNFWDHLDGICFFVSELNR
jgi:hypothetical protein